MALRIGILGSAASIHTQRWVSSLSNLGHQILLLTQDQPLEGDWGDSTEIRRLPFSGRLGYAINSIIVRRALDNWNADLLHSHYAAGYGMCGELSGFRPRVVSVWGSDVYEVPAKGYLYRKLINRILHRADLVTSTSHVMAAQCRSIGVHRDIEVVPFGIDTTIFCPEVAEQKPTVDPKAPIIIGTVKTMHEKYGIDTLIRAFSILHDRSPQSSIRLRIVGGGPDLDALKILAASLGLSEVSEFVGAVAYDKVPEELRKLDIYCAPSRWDSESFGVAIIEASACGLPVIVSNAGGLPEVVNDNETGLIVPRDDPERLADAMDYMVTNQLARTEFGFAGRAHVRSQYEWNNCVLKMQSLYVLL